MRLMLSLVLAICLLLSAAALAEEAPPTLRSASSVEEVEQFLLLPTEEGIAGVQRGYIRYISQSQKRDPAFHKDYWLGGEEGTIMDLTLTRLNGRDLDFHVGVMCSRAAYSMILSYFGIDMSPGEMSRVMGARNLYEPYDEISEMVGIEPVEVKTYVFNTMVNNYLTDDSYSPVYLYLEKPNGNYHALLVVGYMEDTGRYLVVDSSPQWANGTPHHVYFISLNKVRSEIINSTFRQELVGSSVLKVLQWRLIEDDAEETE